MSDLSDEAVSILSDAYEVRLSEVIHDARTVFTWEGPADDLIAHLSRLHAWPADTCVSYAASLRRAMRWNRPNRGW